MRFMNEKNFLQKYMDKTIQDIGKYCFMVDDTFNALKLGAVGDLVIWKNLETERIVLRNN